MNIEDISGNRIISTNAKLEDDSFRLGLEDDSNWKNTEEFTAYFAVLMEEGGSSLFPCRNQ